MAELFIFNQDDRLLTVITEETGLIEARLREELNRIPDQPFSFTIEADTEGASYIVEENQVVFRDMEGDLRLFIIKELDEIDDIDGPQTTAICMPAFAEELQEHIVVEQSLTNQPAQVALDAALKGTRWTGVVEGEFGEASTHFYYISSAVAVWNVLELWGGDIKDVVLINEQNHIVARNVKLLQRLGGDYGKRFEIDHNINEIQRTVISYPVTALYGRGASLSKEDGEGDYTHYLDFTNIEWKTSKGDPVDKPLGQGWVGDPQALQKYGREHNGKLLHREGIWQDHDIEDPAVLLQKTWEQLPKLSKPEVNYRLSVYLLEHIAGYEHERVSLGDTARAIDRQFSRPIEIQTRIIAVEYDLLDIEGTAMVEMGQFLSVYEDDRIEKIEADIDRNRGKWEAEAQPITNDRYPNIKPKAPVNVRAEGGFQVIQIYWDYSNEVYVNYYEVYGSQVKDFVPDSQHLLWRGKVSAFAHTVGTDQTWYYYVRAVNYQDTPSDWSMQVTASTHRVISDDILFGPDLAGHLRELNRISDIIGEGGVDFDNISQHARNLLEQEARTYTAEEVQRVERELVGGLAEKANLDYVDGQFRLLDDEISFVTDTVDNLTTISNNLRSRVEENEQVLSEADGKIVTIETEIDDIEGKLSVAIDELSVVENTIQNQQTQIEANAEAITFKADQDEVETLSGNVRSLSSELQFQAGEIELKADKEELRQVNNRVTGISTDVASLRVSYDSITSTVSSLQYNIDHMEIGGRNYLLDSQFKYETDYWVFYTASTGEGHVSKVGDMVVIDGISGSNGPYSRNGVNRPTFYRGDVVTVSIWIRGQGTLRIGLNGTSTTTFQVNAREYTRFSHTFAINSDVATNAFVFYGIDQCYFEIQQVKAEKSSKPTDWTPAPEDATEDLNGLLDSMTRLESEIRQNATEISSRVTETTFRNTTSSLAKEVDIVSQGLYHAESLIQQNAAQIQLRVTETDFNNLKIGGRNLIPNSTFNKGSWDWVSFSNARASILSPEVDKPDSNILHINYSNFSSNTPIRNRKRTLVKADGSEKATISFDIYADNINRLSHLLFTVRLNQQATGTSETTITNIRRSDIEDEIVEGEWVRVEVTFDIPSNSRKWMTVAFYNSNSNNSGGTVDFKLRELKLELGGKATDWNPAPEDVQNSITNMETSINQLSGKIELTASKDEVNALSGRLTTAQSQIRINSDNINLKVDRDGIVSAINLSKEGIRIQGSLIHLSGLTLIDNGIIKTAHLANASITRAKLGTAVVGTAQIADAAITSAKISSVNADKINAETLSAITANLGTVTAGILRSNNNRLNFNLNNGLLEIRSGGQINFMDPGNGVKYITGSHTAGMIMANSSGLNRPLVAIGVDTGSGVINTNSANFTGMMIQAKDTGRRMQFIGGNYILATRSDLSTAGFVIRSDGSESTRSIYGWNSSTYNYDLGLNSAQFTDGFIQNIKASQVIHLRDAYSTGGWRVETRAQSGKTTITLRGINTNSWNYNLGATGYRINRLFLSNSPDVSSDERLKEDITPNTLGLDFINDLDTNVFRLKQRESDVLQNPLQFGVIAQQLKTTLEQHGIDTTAHSMLSQSEDGFFGVQYEQLIAPTIRAIQELDVKMDDEVNQLKLEIQYLKMKIKHLEENVA